MICDNCGMENALASDVNCWHCGKPVLTPARGSAGGMSLGELSTKAAAVWCGPLTQNHDPSFWKSLREAYAQGYMRGFNECASRKHNDQAHARPEQQKSQP